MADDKPPPGELKFRDAPDAAQEAERPRIAVLSQYVKDLSFESPRAPVSVLQGGDEPHGDLTVQVRSHRLSDEEYEVVLDFQVEAKREGEVVFLIELHYAGVFRVGGFEDDELRRALMIECPRIIYPFARRIIADTVRDGGFPQLMLGPIDFVQLYKVHGDKQPAEAAEA